MPRTQLVDPVLLRTSATQLLDAGIKDEPRLQSLQSVDSRRVVQHRLGVSLTTETFIPSLGQGYECVNGLEFETVPRGNSLKDARGWHRATHSVFRSNKTNVGEHAYILPRCIIQT